MTINPSIFKAYDIRGVYPTDLNEELAYRIAQAYVQYAQPKGKVAVGMDVRLSSPKLKEAVIKGLTDAGIDIVDIGLVSTDMYYFAVGYYKLAGGIQVTASHNPAEYNGIKMVREQAFPIYGEVGIEQIRDMILANKEKIQSDKKGQVEQKNILDDFTSFLLKFIDTKAIKPLKVVINPNFGFQGEVIKYVVKKGNLPITLVGLNDTPDGTFPKGRPDPFVPENRPEFLNLVKNQGADFGIAWDADGDRVFFATEKGDFIESYYMNALFIADILKKNPGAKIIYDPRYTWALIDAAKENGGEAILERVGHSFIKARMRKEDAVFCGESSGHTYFRDFWYADCGVIPALMVMEMVSKKGKKLSELVEPLFNKYFISGEINTTVSNAKMVLEKIKEKYNEAQISEIDGVSIEYADWRANIRPSNTEPLFRLNVEAKSQELLDLKKREIIDFLQKYGPLADGR
ncbi:phosphomannomutase [Candidatus Woesebacteria bacterium CG_4_10_14_0_2_um_filter_39_14]|uniref:Phosphomannomutase n=3 Tax=Microgenomates group TaxID=1794810 RepID=A0A2M6YQF5_9BACT|nr:MAG: phosphomannomutase [Candidatus Shapirobacteria bacterium CG07_land_8_20_14_0_80_39_12]PIZ49681.1 MAG: phosphomannomutase [Candidatus Woesebacteria bacterium CG_4_10_14_0_2_um_filter_39_14]PJA50008.1 MAG: phosphomannomutase [Candidatus Shapirobacteria bacterium CG_4_9_14_3_um_filter_39_13]